MNKREACFDVGRYNASEYTDVYLTPVNSTMDILTPVVERYGVEIFLDTDALRRAMAEAGIGEEDICRICLMTKVSGFRELLNQDSRTLQVDMDRYIQNAAVETGFQRDMVLRLTSCIMSAIGEKMEGGLSVHGPSFSPRAVAALAVPLYEKHLRTIQFEFDKGKAGKLDFDKLEALVNIGIPRAKYYLGYCLLNGVQVEASRERGVELLEEAADMGDSRAAAALGDYYYAEGGSGSWTKAYQYYTGFGAAALNRSQRTAVTSILNQGIFNQRLLKICAVLLTVFSITVIWPPASGLYSSHPVAGWLSILTELVLLAGGWLYYRLMPYNVLYGLPVTMSGVWCIYMAVRFLF